MKKKLAISLAIAIPALALVVLLAFQLSSPAYADGDTAPPGTGSQFVPGLLSSGITLTTQEHTAYMSGSDGHFYPDNSLTRAEAAQIIYRLLSRTPAITASFSDVPAGSWYADAANTLGTLGVATGDRFRPSDNITRGEFVRYIASFFPRRNDAVQFTDVPAGHPDAAYFISARAWGWLTGFSDGSVHPDASLTRAEAAAILNRALGRSPDKNYIDSSRPIFYWDVSPYSWYYYDVAEASVAHGHSGSAGAEQWTSCTPVSAGIKEGFLHKDGWLYYFDAEKNDIVRNAAVGSFDFNSLGHFTTCNAELDGLLRDVYLENTTEDMTSEEKLRALYLYTRDSFSYLRRPPYKFGVLDYMEQDALTILTTGKGNCYCYASLFWYLSRWAGYDSQIYNGTVGQRKSPHSWVEIISDGKSYIYDTELEMAYRKKGEYINMYKWTGSGWNYIR